MTGQHPEAPSGQGRQQDGAASAPPPAATPLVSVIIPIRNAAHTLDRALDSVAAQHWQDWEAVLVDDASTDDSPAIARARAQTDPRFRCVGLAHNHGVSGARNAGLDAARGRYIAFLDADDAWHPEKLARQIPLLQGGEVLVCAAYRRVDEAGRNLGVSRPPARITYAAALGGNPIGCLTAVWDRRRFPEARMPDLPLHEDYAFWLTMLRSGAEARGLPDVLADYTVRRNSRSARKWRAALATWQVLRAQPGLGLPRSMAGFIRYGWRSLRRIVAQNTGRRTGSHE